MIVAMDFGMKMGMFYGGNVKNLVEKVVKMEKKG